MRMKDIKKRGFDKDLRFFLELNEYENDGKITYRWIESTGWVIDRGENSVTVRSPMGGEDIIKNPIEFTRKSECMKMKDRLNSEIVLHNEPEHWIITWQETYARTHKNLKYQTLSIQGKRCLMGEEIPFISNELFGLQVGDKIVKLGQRTSTSSCEVEFIPSVSYAGFMHIAENTYAAFRVPDNGVVGFSDSKPARPLYVLFSIDFENRILYEIRDDRGTANPYYPIYRMEDGQLRIDEALLTPSGTTKHITMIKRIVKLARK